MTRPRSDNGLGTEFRTGIPHLTNICRAASFVGQLLWLNPGEAALNKAQGLSSKAAARPQDGLAKARRSQRKVSQGQGGFLEA